MPQVEIKFTAQGHSHIVGNFAPGDLLRCAPEVAKHLVEEAKAAEYTAPAAHQAGAEAPAQPATKPRAKRAAKPEQVQE